MKTEANPIITSIWKIWSYLPILFVTELMGKNFWMEESFMENVIENLQRAGKVSDLIFHCETYKRCTLFFLFSNEMQILDFRIITYTA